MGTAQPQDEFFNGIVKKTYEEMKFSDCLYQRVDISKVNLDKLKPWINKKITDCLHIENKVVADFVCEQLQKEKCPCPKQLHINMTGFLTDPHAQQFMDELWALLISAEESENGIPAVCLESENHKIAAKVGEEQEQQLPQSNSNEICNSNNEDNIRECQSTQGDKSELSDDEIDENRSSRNRSWDRSERNRNSPDRKMNDSHEKQSQRRPRSAYRRSPERKNQRYRSKGRNSHRYESPQRRRDISWTRSRQSRSRFVEKRKASPASLKSNRSEYRDSHSTQNAFYCEQLQKEKCPCPKQLHINMTDFLTDPHAQQFMDELWALLISAEESENGIPAVCLESENHKIAAKVGEEQEQQLPQSNSNEICNSNNEDNIRECQSTQGDKSELSDDEIDENRSSRNRSWDRSERNRNSPDRKMNDSHEKQSQRRPRSAYRRSPERKNQRYRSKGRNSHRYESPQRRRDISWTRSRQSRSRFVEKRKASPASLKSNRSEYRDSHSTQNAFYCEQLQKEKCPCPKQLHINMTDFLTDPHAQQFMDELWALLISAEESENGIPAVCLESENHKIAAKVGEEQEQQLPQSNSNEICNSNNEDNIRECQSTQGDKSELSDDEIDENRSSRNRSWDRSERNRNSPDRKMNDSHEKQSQRRPRSAYRRSPERKNQRYRSKGRNSHRYESPQRRRDISWTRSRQSRSRFVEKRKARPASLKSNRSEYRDSHSTQNAFYCEQLQKEKCPCPKQLHINMTGFLTDPHAQQFMDELWALLIPAEESENGIPAVCLESENHKIAAKVGEEQEQQLPQSNSNEICNSNNEDNIRECQSTQGDKSELSDDEIDENRSSRNRSWDRSERNRNSPDRKMNDSHEKQSQRRPRSAYRRSPERKNQRYRSKGRNSHRYESPQRRRDISWTRSRQSRSRFVEKRKASPASLKSNRSEYRDSHSTQNAFYCEQLQKEKCPCPKQLHINMTGFLTDPHAQQFMDELWALLIPAEESENGIPAVCLESENHKIAAKVGEEQEQQLPQSNSNEICNSNNEDNIRECQSTQGDKSELSDDEIDENRSSRNRSWDRSERNRNSPDRKMNDSHEKQSQRRPRSAYRRSPERKNQRYRSKGRNSHRYESPQRRRDISWTRSRQSCSRFVEKRKASPASLKSNRSEYRDSHSTQNGYRNGYTAARNPCNPYAKHSALHSRSKETSASYMRSESRSTYRSSSKHSNHKRRASRSVSFTPSPERILNRGYNKHSSASSLGRDSGRLQGGTRDGSRSKARCFEYNRYRPRSPDRYRGYNRQELRAMQRSRTRQYSPSRSRSLIRSCSQRRSRSRFRQRSFSRNRSRSPRRFNDRCWPLQYRANNRRRLNRWNRKRQSRQRFGARVNRYDQQRYISPQRHFSRERRFSPRRNQFRRNSPQWRDSPQRLSPERRSVLQKENIFSPLQASTPKHEDSTCNSWNQTKNSTVSMTPKKPPPLSKTVYKESQEARAEKRKYCDLEDGNLQDCVTDANEAVNSESEDQYLAKKKRKKSKHNSDDYAPKAKARNGKKHKKRSSKNSKKRDKKYKEENKEAKILGRNDDDNMENTKSELSCTESIMLGSFDENLEVNLENWI